MATSSAAGCKAEWAVAFSALYDACVLYPAPIRDVFLHLTLTDLYRAPLDEPDS